MEHQLAVRPCTGELVMGDESQRPFLQELRVSGEQKAACALWAARPEGINQSSPKFSRPAPNSISFMKPFQIPLLEINLPAPISPGPLLCTFPAVLTTIYLVLEWFMHMSASPTRMWVPEDRNIYEGPFIDFGYCMKDLYSDINYLPCVLRWFYGKTIKIECNLNNYFHVHHQSHCLFFMSIL